MYINLYYEIGFYRLCIRIILYFWNLVEMLNKCFYFILLNIFLWFDNIYYVILLIF